MVGFLVAQGCLGWSGLWLKLQGWALASGLSAIVGSRTGVRGTTGASDCGCDSEAGARGFRV